MTVKTIKLSNGLEVWLNEDHTSSVITGAVAVKAGAKDCPDTGIAHYFEHIMFKGTDRIGTVDYAKEKPFLDSISEQYSRLKRTADPNERLEIQKNINELSVLAAQYAVPNEFSTLINTFGGSQLNAATSYDYTVFFNAFAPQYIKPWLELNSERLIHPVFRFFQSELETVYEEKNMYSDNPTYGAMERGLDRIFSPHPYGKPIIGSTENLKNPDLAEMQHFFSHYYVAGNMALILSGDFNTDDILPLIERYFSRIPAGEAPRQVHPQPAPFQGDEKVPLKVPIPMVKGTVDVWRTVPKNNSDEAALKIALKLLTNSNGTGRLDKLTKNRKLLMAVAYHFQLNEAGILAIASIPKLVLYSAKAAEKKCLNAIEQIKTGNFTDDEFRSAKLEYLREHNLELENAKTRTFSMIDVYTGGGSWSDFMNNYEKVDAIDKPELLRVVNKYLGNDRLTFVKKFGSYPKDRIDKPKFAPIIPQRDVTESDYAKELIAGNKITFQPRVIDFTKDVNIVKLQNGNRLITVPNPYNDVFRLEIKYDMGYNQLPMANNLPVYLDFLGVDSLSNQQFQEKLRALGTALHYNCHKDNFSIILDGFDRNFDESYALLLRFMHAAIHNSKAVASIIDTKKIADKARQKDNQQLSDILRKYAIFGQNSWSLREHTPAEIKKYPADKFLSDFQTICSKRATVYYSGSLSSKELEQKLDNEFTTGNVALQPKADFPLSKYDSSRIYVLDMPKSRQSVINTIINTGELSLRGKHLSQLFNMYMGGFMSSVLFQEIREYRSYAYSAHSNVYVPKQYRKSQMADFYCILSTQIDKTMNALSLLDSLLQHATFTQERMDMAKQQLMNNINNAFPNFRMRPATVDDNLADGYSYDQNADMAADLQQFTLSDLNDFYRQHIQHKPYCITLVTDTKQLDTQQLAPFGKVIRLTVSDVMK